MRQPLTVPFTPSYLGSIRLVADDQWLGRLGTHQRVIEVGQWLSAVLLPPPVHTLLIRSLERIAPDDGLRIRLCLDEFLNDLPWEFLYRPNATDSESLAGFLVLAPRISLVREAPMASHRIRSSKRKQRMVFFGTLWSGGVDRWEVQPEYRSLAAALEPVEEFLGLDPFCTSAGDQVEMALTQPAAIFHYSGHTDVVDGRGYVCKEVLDPAVVRRGPGQLEVSGLDGQVLFVDPLYSEQLGRFLRKARTRLAVFSACNSGRWTFMEPLIRAGLPALIGTQGLISSCGSAAFCQKLYASLAVVYG
jgi:hypothetical protein